MLDCLRSQRPPSVGILMLVDHGDESIGRKRQRLLEAATAPWVSFIDADDSVDEAYCSRILEVIESNDPPDVIGFRLLHFIEGRLSGEAIHSCDAAKIPTQVPADCNRFNRYPNHLNPIRLNLARRVGFPSKDWGEDAQYSRGLANLRPSLREVFLDWYAYHYRWIPPEKRVGAVTHAKRFRGRGE